VCPLCATSSFPLSWSDLLTRARGTGGAWAEPLHVGRFGTSNSTTGVALKMSKDIEGLYDGAPLQILGYTLTENRVWCVSPSCSLPSHGMAYPLRACLG
jgi:hypothetical protein